MLRLGLVAACLAASAIADEFLFVTFKDPGNAGIWFQLSRDGYRWEMLNHDQPWLRTTPAMGTMRDPFVARGPDGAYHLIWTGGLPGFGYARSRDLVHWSEPRRIQVWPGDTRVRNLWAPEINWDEAHRCWQIIWSSTVAGEFPATEGQVENGKNHRIYAMETTDFVTFTTPHLFFDPGYPVIDATLAPDAAGGWLLFFKDERRTPLHKQIRMSRGPTLQGPWGEPTAPLTEPWTEGPSLLPVIGGWLLFFDAYKPPLGMQALQSADLLTWQRPEHPPQFPPGSKHGGFIRISDAEAVRLRSVTAK